MIRKFHRLVGFEYEVNKKSLILQLIAMTKERSQFTDDELKKMIAITSNYLDKVSRDLESPAELFGHILTADSGIGRIKKPFYKFIPKEIYENHISKGRFQLGSLKYYREIENESSRDEKEGFSNIIIYTGDRQIFASLISGFDQYILCGTHSLDESKYMSERFGGVILKFRNINSFASKTMKAINAFDWHVMDITYSDFKAYIVDQQINDLNGVGPDLGDEMFQHLLNFSTIPSIFCKPTRFKPENEVRLSFKMNRNVKRKLNFCNQGLLDEIEIIK